MLVSCLNALLRMPYGAVELRNPNTIRKVVEKVPGYKQEQWQQLAYKVSQYEYCNTNIDIPVQFIENEAMIANNPLYGKHLLGHRQRLQVILGTSARLK